MNVDPYGYGNYSYGPTSPSSPLLDGNGVTTSAQFQITSSYRNGGGEGVAPSGNNYAYLYPSIGTPQDMTFQFTGLTPGATTR